MKVPLYILPPVEWYVRIFDQPLLAFPDYQPMPDVSGFNRINMGDRNGQLSFTLPLQSASKKGAYSGVQLSYATNWHKQILNAIQTSYGKSPFYEYYDYQLEAIFLKKEESLMQLNMALMKWSLKALRLFPELTITESEEFENPNLEASHLLPYHQVFEDRNGFVPGLSILDLIFNLGVDSGLHLRKISIR